MCCMLYVCMYVCMYAAGRVPLNAAVHPGHHHGPGRVASHEAQCSPSIVTCRPRGSDGCSSIDDQSIGLNTKTIVQK